MSARIKPGWRTRTPYHSRDLALAASAVRVSKRRRLVIMGYRPNRLQTAGEPSTLYSMD
jgi:hypothetical protein